MSLSSSEKCNIEFQIEDLNQCLHGHVLACQGKIDRLTNMLSTTEIAAIKKRLFTLTTKLAEINNAPAPQKPIP